MTSGGSRRRECLKPAKKQALRRPERCAAQVLACLSTVEPPLSGGKGVSPFPALKYSAPAPCRSGSKGEAPWSLRKERNPGYPATCGRGGSPVLFEQAADEGRHLECGVVDGGVIVTQPLLKFRRYRAGRHGHVVAVAGDAGACLLYTSPSPRDRQKSRMPSSA